MGAVERDEPPESVHRRIRVCGDGEPYAPNHVEIVDAPPSPDSAVGDVPQHILYVLWREEEWQTAVCYLPRKLQHPSALGAEVDRDALPNRLEPHVGVLRPAFEGLALVLDPLAAQEPPYQPYGLAHSRERSPGLYPHPPQELQGSDADAETGPSARVLVEGGGVHRELGWVDGIGVDHARA